LTSSFIVYLNPDTLEVEEIPQAVFDYGFLAYNNEYGGYDPDDFQHEKWERVIKMEPLDSRESYTVMEDFVEQLSDKEEVGKLSQALSGYKPFANFNHLIHNSDYRLDWFAFRQKTMEKYVIRKYFRRYLNPKN
jgi:hypothetical protein